MKSAVQGIRDIGKVAVDVKRELKVGLYVTSTRSQRHLTKPLRRYGQEKQSSKLKA